MRQVTFIVHGKVQGVWFRAWTRDMAREMGVTGWVRNMSDGNVEGIACGSNELLKEFLIRLHDGPPLARVTSVDTEWQDIDEPATGFDIRR